MVGNATNFRDDVSFEVSKGGGIKLGYCEVTTRVSVKGEYSGECIFDRAIMHGALNFRDCHFRSKLTFGNTVFRPTCTLDVSHSIISESLRIIGRPSAPREIRLDGAEILGSTHIETELGIPPVRIIARNEFPRFGGTAVFTNADLSQCRIVGNNITRLEPTNVQWAQRFMRTVVYDEIAMRRGASIPVSNLKEACQILKQKYQSMGDHVKAGDFHYSEMEMKRREYKGLIRYLCPEFFYWLASGYGTGYIRAFLMLVALAFGFGWLYLSTSPDSFALDYWKAVRFSIQVITLQRPQTPEAFGDTGQWFQLAEAILGPLQIALFALALRMRLKR